MSDGSPEGEWRANLIESADGIAQLLSNARRIAVVGCKTEAQGGQPAFYVPQYLQRAGYEVVPVPVYYPNVETILGEKVYRAVAEIPEPVDIVVLFRRPRDIPPHIEDILDSEPAAVWMQSGIWHDDAAEQFARNGIKVVQDRCIMIEDRRVR